MKTRVNLSWRERAEIAESQLQKLGEHMVALEARAVGAQAKCERLEGALNSVWDVAERMNPDQGFNSQGRLSRCAELASAALTQGADQ